MPHFSGIEALKMIRAMDADVPLKVMRYSSDQASNAFKFLQLPCPIVQAFALLTFHAAPAALPGPVV
jgi:hypothetical protein